MTARGSDLNGLLGRITTWTTVVLVAAVLITTAVVLYPSIVGAVSPPAPPAAPAYETGSRVDTPAEWHEGSPYTLVLFAQASCGACQRAQPFLKDLVTEFAERAPVLMVSPAADPAGDAPYATSLGVDPSRLHGLPGRVRARVTPTLVLIDRAGTVLHAWEGMPPEHHAAILTAIREKTRIG